MRKTLLVVATLSALTSNAIAADDSGSYIAFDALQSSAPGVCDPLFSGTNFSCTNQTSGRRIAVGHNFGNYFGIEGGYFDSGSAEAKVINGTAVTDFSAEEMAFQLAGTFTLHASKNISYFAKLGLNRYVLDETKSGDTNGSRSVTGGSPLWGVGVEIKSDSGVGMRVQYEEHKIRDTFWDFSTAMRSISIGIVLHPSAMNLHSRF